MGQETSHQDELVYMVSGLDEHGDTHIFVTSNKCRAEAPYALRLDKHTDAKVNWIG